MGKSKESYANKHGEISEEELIKIKKEGNVDKFLREFKVIEQPCPSKNLRPKGGMCFYCL